MLSAIQNYVNDNLVPFHTTGAAAGGIAISPTLYNADYLVTHGFIFPFSVWIQGVTGLYVLSLFIMIIPKVIGKMASMYKYIVNIFDELGRKP